MIAAVAVVAILIGSSAYVMFLAPMKARMTPDDPTVDAGQALALSVSVKKGIKTLTDSSDVKYRWRLTPDTLATFDLKSKPRVNVTAGIVAGTGSLSCEVTYKGTVTVLTKQLTVKPPFLDQIVILPSTKTLEKGMSKTFTASAMDSVANPVANLTYTWTVSGPVTATLNATTGASVNLTAGSDYGNVTLSATATWQSVTKSGSAKVTIGPLPPRKIDYRWYDMFDVPFGEWWNMRWSTYKTELAITDSYPYLFKYYYMPEGNVKTYGNMRLNITGRNVSDVNMNERAEFLPMHGPSRGGNAVIDWYLQYLTTAEMGRYPDNTAGWSDGWVVSLNGTVTLDREGAMTVIKGLTSSNWDSFNSWWAQHSSEVSNDITSWLAFEAGKERTNIYPAYDGTFQMLSGKITGGRVGDKLVLNYDIVTWGMEALIMRWLRETIMPTEWWFEDLNFHMAIGPENSRVDIDTAVAYAVYAWDTTMTPTQPAWVWEAMLQDVDPSAPPDVPYSDIDKYLDYKYLNRAPGNKYYGGMMGYDYTPGAWNLSTNETLTLEWPSGQQEFEIHVPPPTGSNFASISPTYDTMAVKYGEPMGYDNAQIAPGTVQIDNAAQKVTFTGPMDAWDWSKNQTTHLAPQQNWSRIGMLPHGVPWIEFEPEHGYVAWADRFVTTNLPQMPVIDTPVNITVTVLDNYGRVYPEFDGILHFDCNRTDVVLPADYQFDALIDGGKHSFPYGLTFQGLGEYNISLTAVGRNTTGYNADIWVIPVPEQIDHFSLEVQGVRGIVIKGLETTVKVTAYNQYPAPHDVFHEYNGTVTFSTDAPAGTYTLPADTTFSPASSGVAVLYGLLFNEMGTYDLTATDTVVTIATGSATVKVSLPPEINYRLYDMFEQPWGDFWEWRLTGYKTDVVLNDRPHEYTMLYNPDMRNLQGIIYAPYRWNMTAVNMTTVSVHSPEFMPILGTPGQAGAEVDMHIWFEYLDNETWNGYWKPTWGTNSNWSASFDGFMPLSGTGGQFADGYYLGVLYTVSMNREAALEWLGMPTSDTPATWWAANGASYMEQWQRWIWYEGNFRLDIWPAYEWPYIDMGTMMDFVEEPTGEVTLRIAHFGWGFESLMIRWLNETAMCVHEPYMEDFNLSAHFAEEYANVTFDAVAQYNLHAVRANGTVDDAAWVWEPQRMDYVFYNNPTTGYVSEFNPWVWPMNYTSWNAGDGYFGDPIGVPYDMAPQWFNLTNYMTMEIQLPLGDSVIGYLGEKLATGTRSGAIYNLKPPTRNTSAYDNITIHGPMTLGYNMTGTGPGAVNMWDHYDPVTNKILLEGPMAFDNFRHPNGYLYHSAPWIEFNVANLTQGPLPKVATVVAESVEDAPIGSTSSIDVLVVQLAGIALLMVGSMAVVATLSEDVRRKD